MAAYSFLTRCDRALAASHCLSRVQRLKTSDVRTYSHMAELALTNELLVTPLAALATHHNWYKSFLMLVSFFFLLVSFSFVAYPLSRSLLCSCLNSSNLCCPTYVLFFHRPLSLPYYPGPAANDAAATSSPVNRPCVYKVSINVPTSTETADVTLFQQLET